MFDEGDLREIKGQTWDELRLNSNNFYFSALLNPLPNRRARPFFKLGASFLRLGMGMEKCGEEKLPSFEVISNISEVE